MQYYSFAGCLLETLYIMITNGTILVFFSNNETLSISRYRDHSDIGLFKNY